VPTVIAFGDPGSPGQAPRVLTKHSVHPFSWRILLVSMSEALIKTPQELDAWLTVCRKHGLVYFEAEGVKFQLGPVFPDYVEPAAEPAQHVEQTAVDDAFGGLHDILRGQRGIGLS
jgi:hypothetical protein